MKKLLLITNLSFPTGSAMASRLLSFCHLFKELEYDIHVITTRSNDDKCEFDYEVVQSNRSIALQTYLGNENIVNRIDEYLNNNQVDLVFMTSCGMNFKEILNVCHKHNKKVILEQCEWYDYSSFKFGKIDPRYTNFKRNIIKEYFKVDSVISISRLLDNYYKSNNFKSIRIPSILDVKNKPINKSNSEKIKLVYTGNASKSKELLEPIIEALVSKQEYLDRFTFDIYGLDKDQLENRLDKKELLTKASNVVAHGFVNQEKIEDILLNANYQIFIRPNRQSSNAGFPTKLCESMAVGTPVITNDTGDICLYVKDSINGLISKDITKESIVEVFDKIINMSEIDYNNLKLEARITAETSFDYRNYIEIVRKFIETL